MRWKGSRLQPAVEKGMPQQALQDAMWTAWGERQGRLQPADASGGDAEPESEETLEGTKRFQVRAALRAGR